MHGRDVLRETCAPDASGNGEEDDWSYIVMMRCAVGCGCTPGSGSLQKHEVDSANMKGTLPETFLVLVINSLISLDTSGSLHAV